MTVRVLIRRRWLQRSVRLFLVRSTMIGAVALISPVFAAAQDLPEGETIWLTARSKGINRVPGQVVQLREDSILFLPAGSQAPVSLSQAETRLEVRTRLSAGTRARRGARLGAGLGVVAGLAAAAGYRSTYGSDAELSVPMSVVFFSSAGVGFGALLGALSGTALPARGWQRVRLDD